MFKKNVSLVAVVLMAIPPRLYALGASGFSSQFVGARALGQGNTFVAEADDASTVFFNPAGMTQLQGSQFSLGATFLEGYTDRTGNGLADEHMAVNPSTLPNMYATFTLPSWNDHKLSAGIGWNSPFGLTTEWEKNSSLHYVTTLSKFQMYNLNPSLAMQVTPMLSIGAGADYVRLFSTVGEAQFPNAGPGDPDGSSRLTGHGSGWGYNVGTLFKPTEKHAFGLTYRSQVRIPITGNVNLSGISPTTQDPSAFNFAGPNYSVGAHSSVILPASILGGYAFRPTPDWTILLDYEWTQWNVFQNQDVALDETDPQRLGFLTGGVGPAANVIRTPRQWHNVSAVGGGVNYKINPAWEVRGGYAFYEKTVPNDTFSPDVPDASNHFVSVGCSRKWNAWSLDLAVGSFIYANRDVSNNVGSLTGSSVNGTYHTFAPLLALNANYKFGGNQ